jgi:hypothetical protein
LVALSFIETTSLPEPVSDMASEPTNLPLRRLGRNLAFCSGVPWRLSWLTQRLELRG